jgi:tetratricopeptide (TPR) repeat protein
MSLRDAVNFLLGGKGSNQERPDRKDCPRESNMLAYLENRLSGGERKNLEKHFARCEHCREILSIYSQVSEEIESQASPLAEEAVRQQTAIVLAAIDKDQSERARLQQQARPAPTRFFIPYHQLAVAAGVIITFSVALIFFITREPSPEEFAMQSLVQIIKGKRPTQARMSGEFAWSEFKSTRGEEDDERLRLKNALNLMKDADSLSAPRESRHIRARLLLASADYNDVERALEILDQIISLGQPSPEAINDRGVALLQLGKYEEASDAFQRVLEKSPNYDEALFNKALASEHTGNSDQARRDWAEFISKSSNEDWKKEARKRLDQLSPTR